MFSLVWGPDQITCNSEVLGTLLPKMLLLWEQCLPSLRLPSSGPRRKLDPSQP